MTHGSALLLARVASFLALLLEVAHAQPSCRASAAVDLTIELEPPEATARLQLQQLHQRLDAELQLREQEACPVPAGGQRRRAHVYVLAPVPELSPTFILVYTDEGARLERKLDVAALPAEARPAAIASAADELLSALLDSIIEPSARGAGGAVVAAEPRATPLRQKLPWRLPQLELGLGGGGALFRQEGKAYGAEALARWRPKHLLSVALSVGADRGSGTIPLAYALLAAPVARGRRLYSAWHLGLDVGFDLLEPAERLWLAANVGLTLARIQRTAELEVSTPAGQELQRVAIGGSWELAASPGVEVSYRVGPWGIALALALLVPLTTPEPQEQPAAPPGSPQSQWEAWNDVRESGVGFGEQLGGQLALRLWFVLAP